MTPGRGVADASATVRGSTTVYDVADHAGVSIATVSRVVKDHPNVATTTRARVRASIEELGWRPSATARALAGRTHGAVAIVFPDLGGPYYAEVIRGFEARSVDRAAVHILATHGRAGAEGLVRDLAERVDGLVVMGETVRDDVVADLVSGGLPVVLLARPPVAGAPAIRTDNDGSARVLAGHLADHGHDEVLFLGDLAGTPDVADRFRGIAAGLEEYGRPAPRVVTPTGFHRDDGAVAFRRAWNGGLRPTAIAAANDQLAVGICTAAAELGLAVGSDLAVTGWDDQPVAGLVTPGLTTVNQPMAELGRRAADAVFDRAAGGQPDSVVLATDLVVRASCGCSPATPTTRAGPGAHR